MQICKCGWPGYDLWPSLPDSWLDLHNYEWPPCYDEHMAVFARAGTWLDYELCFAPTNAEVEAAQANREAQFIPPPSHSTVASWADTILNALLGSAAALMDVDQDCDVIWGVYHRGRPVLWYTMML